MQLIDKHVIIIGAGSGIGRALALAAAQAGARLALVGRRRAALEQTAALLPAPPRLHVADVTREPEVIELYEALGAFDHLVCTASQTAAGKVTELEVAAVERALAAKLWAPLFLLKHGAKRVAPTGSFTLFSGIRGARPTPGSSVTSMANCGLEGFARAMAVELGPVRVNVVSPGIVDSGPFWDRLSPEARAKMFADYAAKVPARRVGAPEDVAAAALFAMTNPLVTGSVLAVEGGGLLA